jgi:hypothetical protein
MRITFIYFIIIFSTINLAAQSTNNKLLKVNVGYGTENNYGNTAFVFGIGYQKTLSKKFSIHTDADYFTTSIYNAYLQNDRKIPNEERFYYSLFLSGRAAYSVIGNINTFSINLSAGPTLYYYKYRILNTWRTIIYPDGTVYVDPSRTTYYNENKIRFAYNAGIDFNIPVKNNIQVSVGLNTYSSKIPIEFFIPTLSVKKILK